MFETVRQILRHLIFLYAGALPLNNYFESNYTCLAVRRNFHILRAHILLLLQLTNQEFREFNSLYSDLVCHIHLHYRTRLTQTPSHFPHLEEQFV